MKDLSDFAFGQRDEEPANRKGRHRDFIRPGPGQTVKALCISESPTMCYTHWIADGSVLCPGAARGCAHCINGTAPAARRRGFLCGRSFKDGTEVVIELTDEALKTNPAFRPGAESLVGAVIYLGRRGSAKNGVVYASVARKEHIPGFLRRQFPAFDLLEQIKRTFSPPLILADPVEIPEEPEEAIELFEPFELNEENGEVA